MKKKNNKNKNKNEKKQMKWNIEKDWKGKKKMENWKS